jgi:hypothetical protein
MGRDFPIPPRPYRAHLFVGGNAFLLDLLARHRQELGVIAPAAALERMARATRAQLADRTARVQVAALERREGRLEFTVAVENLCGHKFPSGYPARRAWLRVEVRSGSKVLFQSGSCDEQGRLLGVADELALPHLDRIERSDQVQVWELVAHDSDGRPTTALGAMATRAKDNRLLPRGWRADGPHVDSTAPLGVAGDTDFEAGGDRVRFSVPLEHDTPRGVRVLAWLHYQTIPPAWVEPMRTLDDEECRTFVRLYDATDHVPETIATGQASEP